MHVDVYHRAAPPALSGFIMQWNLLSDACSQRDAVRKTSCRLGRHGPFRILVVPHCQPAIAVVMANSIFCIALTLSHLSAPTLNLNHIAGFVTWILCQMVNPVSGQPLYPINPQVPPKLSLGRHIVNIQELPINSAKDHIKHLWPAVLGRKDGIRKACATTPAKAPSAPLGGFAEGQ